MKVIILAGGLGSRLSEETELRPKPMVEIGERPILWHIMKIYSYYGFNDFIILTGYKSHVIKDFFIHYYQRYSDVTVDLSNNSVEVHETHTEPWTVTMLYTGQHDMTGSRIKQAQKYVKDETFMLTYGDCVGDINITDLIRAHKQSGKIATVTAVQPRGKFGALRIENEADITSFTEKPEESRNWISGGYFVLEPEIFDYIPESDESVIWERAPLENIARNGELNAYKHKSFWHPMDTLKEKIDLSAMWEKKAAPWAVWMNKDD